MRLVFDLKEEINPQVFSLKPIGDYQHRLVFDLYPAKLVDPITALIEKGEWQKDDALTAAMSGNSKGENADGKADNKTDNKSEQKS